MNRPDHATLVKRARSWLVNHRGCVVVSSEVVAGRENADAIGFSHWSSTLVECKANRSDFLTDQKKSFRRIPELGMGAARYYAAPKGMIDPEELSPGWGLLEVSGRAIVEVKESGRHEVDHRSELSLLVSLLRRVGASSPWATIKVYKIPAQKEPKGVLIMRELEVTP